MRVLMLSWEYPPLVVGGLGRHVEALARALVAGGHDVRVVCRGEAPQVVAEVCDGVRVVRAAVDPLDIGFTTESLLAWAQAGEHAMLRAALPALDGWRPDVVHAHDWLVAQSGVTLAGVAGVPLVATLHATEAGRHQGWLPKPLNQAIHSVERWLATRADAVIACSPTMRDELASLFGLGPDGVAVVPNGLDPTRWRPPSRTARAPATVDGPVLALAGRLVHEKGVQTLIETIRPLRETHPGLRLVIAGTGGHEPELRALARRRRVARAIDWLGFVPESGLPGILGAADVVVVPSLYEPFGIVALESMASGAPTIVARTGGLAEIVDGTGAGLLFEPGNHHELADRIEQVLTQDQLSEGLQSTAAHILAERYTWDAIATSTLSVYMVAVSPVAQPPLPSRDAKRSTVQR